MSVASPWPGLWSRHIKDNPVGNPHYEAGGFGVSHPWAMFMMSHPQTSEDRLWDVKAHTLIGKLKNPFVMGSYLDSSDPLSEPLLGVHVLCDLWWVVFVHFVLIKKPSPTVVFEVGKTAGRWLMGLPNRGAPPQCHPDH